MKRSIGFAVVSLLAAFGVLSPLAMGEEKITHCTTWIIYGSHAPIVAGIEKGIFKAEGLDVTFLRGYGSGDTFKRVATGSCGFGASGAGPAALARVSGLKAKLFSTRNAKNMEGLYYFAESGIKTPKDIEGKRITGGPKAGSDILMWPLFARANGIDPSKVTVIYMESGAKPAAFGAGHVDVVIAWHSDLPRYERVAKEKGKRLIVSLWADHGIEFYGEGLIASDDTLANEKDRTLRFLRAHMKAEIWAFRNREAAVDLFLKKYPEQNRELTLRAQELNFLHLFDRYLDKEGFGRMNREKMARTIEITLEASGIKENLDPEDLYTNEFVDKLPKDLLFFFKR